MYGNYQLNRDRRTCLCSAKDRRAYLREYRCYHSSSVPTIRSRRIQEELSVKNCLYDIAQQKILTLTAELTASNARFKDAEFNFKKFEVSSEKVEAMIENHLKFKNNSTDGLGYHTVAPPFNDNYTPPLEPVVLKRLVIAGQSTVHVPVKIETPVPIKITTPVKIETPVPIKITTPVKLCATTNLESFNAIENSEYTKKLELRSPFEPMYACPPTSYYLRFKTETAPLQTATAIKTAKTVPQKNRNMRIKVQCDKETDCLEHHLCSSVKH
ncbi:hypothetical protein LXL04_005785 [Taraxacum kok-saghyz]